MKQEDYATYSKMSDADLLDFVTETQGSQRGHLARHILASRQHDTMKKATIYAAIAAGLSALGTVIQAAMAVMAYVYPPPH
ncbi:ADP-ribosylglycohydrolase [Bradyrhizobium sp. S3.9.2]|uniref:hypothetical protein n=1 Tax=unclassified Bradyrhizobium TaxID=2631580 RepID=UPI0033939403